MGKILAIDYGEKRIGLSMSDDQNRIALGCDTIFSNSVESAVQMITSIISKNSIDTVIIGLPLTLKGEVGPSAEKAKQFGELLCKSCHKPILYEDERFTSRSADHWHIEGDRDQKSAMLILQNYLDKIHNA